MLLSITINIDDALLEKALTSGNPQAAGELLDQIKVRTGIQIQSSVVQAFGKLMQESGMRLPTKEEIENQSKG